MKLSSDYRLIANDIFPWIWILLAAGMIIVLIVEKFWIGVPFLVLMLLIALFSGMLSDLRKLAEVRAFEDEKEFQIDTGKAIFRIPFTELVDARVRRNFTLIELQFRDRTILFIPQPH